MASFGGGLDLLAFLGTKLLTGLDSDKPNRGYICIPVDMNKISLYNDKNGVCHAEAKFNMWPASKGIVDWWRKQRITAGEAITVYNVPSHRIEINYPEEYQQKLMQGAKAKYIAEHPEECATPEMQDENQNKNLRNYMYNFAHRDLCASVWMHQPKNQVGGSAAPAPQPMQQVSQGQAQVWTPNFNAAPGEMSGGSDGVDDLPF